MAAPLPALGHAVEQLLSERAPVRREATGATPAAVLVGLFEGPSASPHVWLLRRPSGMRTHSGQVALPGGKQDSTDPDLVTTALREAEEEIGLPRRVVRILGTGDDYVTSTGFVVTPVVGWIVDDFIPAPNPSEVTRVFSAPLDIFRDTGVVRAIPWEPIRRMVRAYEFDGEVIWGVTAAILGALVTRIAADARVPPF